MGAGRTARAGRVGRAGLALFGAAAALSGCMVLVIARSTRGVHRVVSKLTMAPVR